MQLEKLFEGTNSRSGKRIHLEAVKNLASTDPGASARSSTMSHRVLVGKLEAVLMPSDREHFVRSFTEWCLALPEADYVVDRSQYLVASRSFTLCHAQRCPLKKYIIKYSFLFLRFPLDKASEAD